jgi:excisionase family DNA binding protein
MSAPELLDDLIDIPGAAALLCISEACVRKWCSIGRLPRYKAGTRTLIRKSDLARLVVPDATAGKDAGVAHAS